MVIVFSIVLSLILFLYINIYYFLWIFHISVSWWSFTVIWVRASLFRSPGLFSVVAVIWMVSIRPPISNSSRSLSKPLGIVPSVAITTGVTVTLMFHSFFSLLASLKFLSLFSFSLILTLCMQVLLINTINSIQHYAFVSTFVNPRDCRFSIFC